MPIGMPSFTFANIIGNVLFSGIGYVVFMYGKKMDRPSLMIKGGVLMAYSYIVSDTFWMYVIGTVLSIWVWFTRFD